MVVDVYWLSYHDDILSRGYWDQGLLEDLFKRGEFIHHTGIDKVPENGGGVVVINGRTHITDADIAKINTDIAKLRWVLFIETGDEEAVFPFEKITHPCKRIWLMLPRMNRHNDVFRIPQGYRPTTHDLLREVGPQARTTDWFFSGQVNHERRAQCVQELKYLIDSNINPNGVLQTGETFGKELIPYREYLEQMAKTRVVLAPSGMETPDNFRLYEALEAGCIPVADAFSTNNQSPGFWNYIFNQQPPFPIVGYWDEFQRLLPTLLSDFSTLSNKIFAWWIKYKRDLYWKLIDDIKELSR